MHITRLVAVAAGAFALSALVPAVAAAEPADGPVAELQQLCEAARGDFYITPYNRARCQFARVTGRHGTTLTAERSICTDVLSGTFTTASSPERPRRVTWACI
jgi:hypothetical protein